MTCTDGLLEYLGRDSLATDSGAASNLYEAYGAEPRQLLLRLRACIAARAPDSDLDLTVALTEKVQARAPFVQRAARTFAQIRQREAAHLALLLDPDLNAQRHHRLASALGELHAHVGVQLVELLQAYGICQQELLTLVRESVADEALRGAAVCVILRRLHIDLEVQAAAYDELEDRRAQVLGEVMRAVQEAVDLRSLYAEVLHALSRLPMLLAAFAAGASTCGWLEVEASAGVRATEYLAAMLEGVIPRIGVGEGHPGPDGPAALAWASGEIRVVDSYALEPSLEPWRAKGLELGLCSSAQVPLLDEAGNSFALLSLYGAVPGCFSAPTRREFLKHLQQALSPAALRHAQGEVLPHAQCRHFADRVHAGAVRMLYQPIVALENGRLLKVEALARLLGDDGAVVGPGVFLRALGRDKLLRLFELGLRQACLDQQSWAAQGMAVTVALNLPPQGASDRAYRDVLMAIVREVGADTRRIELEILETSDGGESEAREGFFAELRALGIRIVQDDLGSGHSSLLRMDTMPFDAVKIDQALVLGAARKDPQRMLEFIHHLTQLAHALGVAVTVEGLEHEGLLEAAAILGADSGQGYGIARPMPAEALMNWSSTHMYTVDVRRPRSALGAMAGHLLWERQLAALRHWPELVEEFVSAPGLVQAYLEGGPPGASRLSALFEQHRSIALGGSESKLHAHSRRRLLAALSALAQS